ncbi:ribonuclease H-like domain-containing protein, partial [Acidobacteriota bacterium]
MELKDKLKNLKKERDARARSQLIRDNWEKIDQEENLSVKEKLEQLINLTGEKKSPKPQAPTSEPVPREPLQFIENPYPLDTRYGKITLSQGLSINGDILSCLSKDPAFETLDLSTALFIDLETTGLSGGTGIIPFNIGMGYYRDERFYVSQYFIGDPGEEERMIQELDQFFEQMNFKSLVTYNGKAFDIPLLETRFILHRQPFPLSDLPHLDFLFPARSLWKHKYESCRLFHLAHEVLETDRAEDIPSAEIPWRYFQYLQTGNYELIEPILYHNQEDILSLLGVVIVGALIFSEEGEESLADAMDFYGAGKVLEKVGELEKSVLYFKKALDGKLSDEVSTQAKKKLSYHFKKKQDWEEAVSLWKEMVSQEAISTTQLFSFRE